MLLCTVLAAVLQLAVALHVRNTLADAAAEGARYAALLGASDADAEARVRALIDGALAETYTDDIAVARRATADGVALEVTVRAPLPVFGLLGPERAMEVTGRATVETLE